MKKIAKENKIITLILIVIIVLQVIAVVFATSKREYYHIDEFYSHALIQYQNAFIYQNQDFTGNWHDTKYFKDYLSIKEEQKFDFSAVYKNQIEDVHPPMYYLLLRIACSFNVGDFSIWPGTILNIILFIFSTLMLYVIGKEIFKNKYYAVLLCLINGFSLASIETVMYVRMYQLVILNILLLIYWHIKKREIKQLGWKDLLPLFILIITGFLTHYYYVIIAGVLWILFIVRYIKNKEKVNAIKYTFTMLGAGLTSLVIFPYAIQHIFMGYRGQEVIENVFQISNISIKLVANILIVNQELFNNFMSILVKGILGLLFICFSYKIYLIHKEKKGEDILERQAEQSPIISYIVLPMIVYFVVIAIASPYQDLRYLMPIIPLIFCSLLYFLRSILQSTVSRKIAFVFLAIIGIGFCLATLPKLADNTYTYGIYADKLHTIENYTKQPWIFVYEQVPVNRNKTMQCYGALLRAEETYVMDLKEASDVKIKEVLSQKNTKEGVMLLVHKNYQKKVIDMAMKTGMFEQYECIATLVQYNVLLLK